MRRRAGACLEALLYGEDGVHVQQQGIDTSGIEVSAFSA